MMEFLTESYTLTIGEIIRFSSIVMLLYIYGRTTKATGKAFWLFLSLIVIFTSILYYT